MSKSWFRYGTQPNRCKSRLTASTPEGLDELHRFQPNSAPSLRRSSSLEDIARFNQYFLLLQSNNGVLFTWRHYLEILQDQLCSFETFAILSKSLLPRLPTTKLQSNMSVYYTPPASTANSAEDLSETQVKPQVTRHRDYSPAEDETQVKRQVTRQQDYSPAEDETQVKRQVTRHRDYSQAEDETQVKRQVTRQQDYSHDEDETQVKRLGYSWVEDETQVKRQVTLQKDSSQAEDEMSVASETSSKSFGSRIKIMKKICSEMKVLARKINKTVAIMSTLPDKCAECGAHLRTDNHTKYCSLMSLSVENAGDMTEVKNRSIALWNDDLELSIAPSVLSFDSSRGAGEMTSYPVKSVKKGTQKKTSIKRLAHLCKQYVKRR